MFVPLKELGQMSPVAHPDSCSLEIKGLGTCFGWANFGDLAGLNAHYCRHVRGGSWCCSMCISGAEILFLHQAR